MILILKQLFYPAPITTEQRIGWNSWFASCQCLSHGSSRAGSGAADHGDGKGTHHATAALGQSASAPTPLFKVINFNATIKLRSLEMSLLLKTSTGIPFLHHQPSVSQKRWCPEYGGISLPIQRSGSAVTCWRAGSGSAAWLVTDALTFWQYPFFKKPSLPWWASSKCKVRPKMKLGQFNQRDNGGENSFTGHLLPFREKSSNVCVDRSTFSSC